MPVVMPMMANEISKIVLLIRGWGVRGGISGTKKPEALVFGVLNSVWLAIFARAGQPVFS